jgi:hypothetical protein
MGFSVDMLNKIRNEASAEYGRVVPEATRENIWRVGTIIFDYEVATNEFFNQLIHKIGKTIIEAQSFKNKLARFKTGTIMSQQDVEEIFVGMMQGTPSTFKSLEDTSNALFTRKNNIPVTVRYHRMNRQDRYEFTIGELDVKRAFKSEETLDAFVTQLFNSVYTRVEYDEYIHMKHLLEKYGHWELPGEEETEDAITGYNKYVDYAVTAVTDEASARAFIRTVRKASMDMSFMSNKCNTDGLMLATPVESQVLFINKDVLAHVDVDVLAKSFNLGKTDFQTEVVVLDDFGKLPDTYALLVDKDFFRVYDTYSAMKKHENGASLFTNYFYHVHQILSISPYKNAVRFTTNPVEYWE